MGTVDVEDIAVKDFSGDFNWEAYRSDLRGGRLRRYMGNYAGYVRGSSRRIHSERDIVEEFMKREFEEGSYLVVHIREEDLGE